MWLRTTHYKRFFWCLSRKNFLIAHANKCIQSKHEIFFQLSQNLERRLLAEKQKSQMASMQQQQPPQKPSLTASAFRDCAGEEEHTKKTPQTPQDESSSSAASAAPAPSTTESGTSDSTTTVVQQTSAKESQQQPTAKHHSPSVMGTIRNALRSYYELWKPRLSSLVVLTTLGGYYALGGYKHDWKTQASVATGTFLQAACANRYVTALLIS